MKLPSSRLKKLSLSLSLSLLKKNKKSAGFTIVELLIVIVIIGILAALVIVAYRGIQQRAQNTSRIASAKAVQKLLNAYVAQEGAYPSPSEACIGAGYTDWDGDSSPDCWIKGGFSYHPNAALDTELKKVANIPNVDTTDIPATGAAALRGYLYFGNQTIDGTAGRRLLQYFLQGTNQDCRLPGQLKDVGANFASNTGAINTVPNFYGDTQCEVAIDQP